MFLRINDVVCVGENAGRYGKLHYRAVVGISPCEFYAVEFFVTVLHLAGAVGDENVSHYVWLGVVDGVVLDTEYLVRGKELVYPLRFVSGERSGFHFVGLAD